MLKACRLIRFMNSCPSPISPRRGHYKTWIRLLYPDNSMETSQEVTVSVYDHTWKAKKTVKKHKKLIRRARSPSA